MIKFETIRDYHKLSILIAISHRKVVDNSPFSLTTANMQCFRVPYPFSHRLYLVRFDHPDQFHTMMGMVLLVFSRLLSFLSFLVS